jgi:mannitol/fructose-specific phosphotransferase system IIA component (Ntr-type)
LGLLELIRQRLVYVGLTGADKRAVITELIDFLVREGALDASRRAAVLRAVWGRERFMSTGMEQGIALPHGVTDAVEEEVAAIGVSREGVPFESFDGEPAHIVILLLTPTLKALTRVRTLAEIVRLVGNAEVRRRILQAPGRDGVIEILRQATGSDERSAGGARG